jgi:anti-sigma factor ChrR (cupin superfamily)
MPSNFKNYPYGAYLCDSSIVYFDRRYRPIVRLTQPDWSVTVCDPQERIKHSGQEWLYYGAKSPRRSAQTRRALQNLLDAIPEMAAEVRRRNAARVPA